MSAKANDIPVPYFDDKDTRGIVRRIPPTMASQHPDHARAPSWLSDPFISVGQEIEEAYRMFSEYGIPEYKWDWEGKYVDEAVIERLLQERFSFFQKHPLGKDFFLTFRLPNPKVETEFRLGRAFMGMVSASQLARQLSLHTPPIFEAILPMTESASEMIALEEAFAEVASLKHPLLNGNEELDHMLYVIPLFEQVEVIMSADRILQEYVDRHRATFGREVSYIRPYLARSDPALNSGFVPAVLAVKIALSRITQWSEVSGIPTFPIIGVAALPFRGGLDPYTVDEFLSQYAGARTLIIQSAFRYDFPHADVVSGIRVLNERTPHTVAQRISQKEEDTLRLIMNIFEDDYRATVEDDLFATTVNAIAPHLPKRRERVQHIGLFGYSRGVGRVRLPRAIGFTGALYSLGVPPEIIGTGRALNKMKRSGLLEALERAYPCLRSDLLRAGRFVNKDTLGKLARTSQGWHAVLQDVAGVEEYCGCELGPLSPNEREHHRLVAAAWKERESGSRDREYYNLLAVLRRSLG